MSSDIKFSSESPVGFGPFVFHRQQRLVTCDGEPLGLGGRALDILQVLVANAGTFVSKQALIARVWPDRVVEDINLRVHIAALRRAFENGRCNRRYILNHPRQGYCFAVPVDGPVRVERHNLPARLSPVIGRDKLLGRLLVDVPRQPLTTVTGAGGCGKTAVVLRVAELLLEHFEDGAWFIDLADVREPCQVAKKIAQALTLQPGPLGAQLSTSRLLLVLDSCEHTLDACRELALILRVSAPGVSLLVSSREPLQLTGEAVVQLPGLAVASPLDPEHQILASPAVQLLVELVEARQQGFKPQNADAATLAHICQRLDGLPLALELAAAHVGALGLGGVLQQLDQGLGLLRNGRRTAVARHASLEALLDWSFARLSAEEQTVLQRLAMLNGGFSLNDAHAVVGCAERGTWQVSGLLSRLASQSLMTVEQTGDDVRFCLLHTTRVYAREKLRRSGRWHLFHRRYVAPPGLIARPGGWVSSGQRLEQPASFV